MNHEARVGASGAVAASLLVAFLIPLAAFAQDNGPADFNTLRTPSSPAFVLLGVEPSSVEKPNTPSDFAASILSATSNLSALPKDYALETSPYWLFSHRRKSWRDDINRNVLESVTRTFTLSVATAELGTSDAPVRGLAVSGRLSLFSGRLQDSSVKQIESLENVLAASAATDLGVLAPVFDSILATLLGSATTMADSLAALAKFDSLKTEAITSLASSGAIETDTEELTQQAEAIVMAREGFQVDLAGGTAWRAPSAALDSTDFDRFGLWLTASYTANDLSFIALARYLGIDGTDQDVLDFGGRFIYAQDRFALSAEYVDRHINNGPGDQWRLAGVFDYRVSRAIWLTGTFGRNYDDDARGSLLAQLGLSLNLSKKRYAFEPTEP